MSLAQYITSLTLLLTSVQCNEVHPVCSGCQRHGVQCVYNNPELRTVDHQVKNASKNVPEKSMTQPDVEYPESQQRRLLELKLLTQWLTKSAFTLPGSDDKDYRESMLLSAPTETLQFRAWTYTLFAFSAIHIAKTSSSPTERQNFMDTFHRYLDLALQEHRHDVANLCKEKANIICLASSMIRNCMQALLQERELVPYTPPSQWLHMMSGSGDVFKTAWAWVREDKTSLAWKISTTGPDLSNLEELFGEKKREQFKHLLHRTPLHEDLEPWSTEVQLAYERTLSYIGSIQIAIDGGEKRWQTFRRVVVFPMFAPKRYIELVEEGQPRALAVLAHYFSFLARLRDVWWVGDTGRREIRAIQILLDSPWVEQLKWPLNQMEEVWDIRPWE
jgi:hypothetical protein